VLAGRCTLEVLLFAGLTLGFDGARGAMRGCTLEEVEDRGEELYPLLDRDELEEEVEGLR
jgi:hypothetical protein